MENQVLWTLGPLCVSNTQYIQNSKVMIKKTDRNGMHDAGWNLWHTEFVRRRDYTEERGDSRCGDIQILCMIRSDMKSEYVSYQTGTISINRSIIRKEKHWNIAWRLAFLSRKDQFHMYVQCCPDMFIPNREMMQWKLWPLAAQSQPVAARKTKCCGEHPGEATTSFFQVLALENDFEIFVSPFMVILHGDSGWRIFDSQILNSIRQGIVTKGRFWWYAAMVQGLGSPNDRQLFPRRSKVQIVMIPLPWLEDRKVFDGF